MAQSTQTRPSHDLIRAVRAELRRMADPDKAAPMRAYMKSEMPFLGVQAKEMRRACREVFPRFELSPAAVWRATVLALWRSARHREERYAAVELTGQRRYDGYQTMHALSMYEEMITTGAWWDLVDPIATQRLGVLLRRRPSAMAARMRRWSRSRDLWKRRAAILCQLKLRSDSSTDLLLDCIRPSIESREFFLRKAIGWALREHAKTDPAFVVGVVRRHRDRLSGLSKREALRNLIRAGRLKRIP